MYNMVVKAIIDFCKHKTDQTKYLTWLLFFKTHDLKNEEKLRVLSCFLKLFVIYTT